MAAYKIVFTDQASREIRRLSPDVARRCRGALELLVENPLRGKPLMGEWKGLYRWRVGDFRIVYRIRRGELIIVVLTVAHRREVYRRKPKGIK